jgi:integrase/recombinase XerD
MSDLVPRKPFRETAVEEWARLSLSPRTQSSYRDVARAFRTLLGTPLVEASVEDVRRWRDRLIEDGKKLGTVRHHLTVLRSLYKHLEREGFVERNPAAPVPLPALPDESVGRALTVKEVRYLLAGPNRARVVGARDYAMLLLLVRTGMRVSELCQLRVSSIRTAKGWRVLEVRVKGGRDRQLPLPDDVWKSIEAYLTHPGEPKTTAAPGTASESMRRKLAHSDGERAWLFQPSVNYRTQVHDRPLTTRQVHSIVSRYAMLAGIKGKVSPHDLRRTFVTLALDQGLTPRQIVAATGHKDERMISRYDKGRENLEINAINFLSLADPQGS